jgi:hypothetical protein
MSGSHEISRWVNKSRSWTSLLRGFFGEVLRIADRPVSISGFVAGVISIGVTLLIASAPIWRSVLDEEVTLKSSDIGLVGLMALLLSVRWMVERTRNATRRARLKAALEEREVANVSAVMHFFSENLRFRTDAINLARRDMLIGHVLKAIRARIAQTIGGVGDEYFAVTLILFGHERCPDKAFIRHRSDDSGNRRSAYGVEVDGCAAFHVTRYGAKVKIEDQFSKNPIFKGKGLSETGNAPYESIVFLPLPPPIDKKEQGEGAVSLGCVTIDCGKPFAFWKVQPTSFPAIIRPYLFLLNMLVFEECEGIGIEDA